MCKNSVRLLVLILTFAVGLSAVGGWFYYQESQRIKIELPNDRWEPLYFKLINKTTELAEFEELRKTNLEKNDIEIRVWRGFGLGSLEAVILKKTNDQWTAFHLKADHYAEPQQVDATELNQPKSGWNAFWNNIVQKGILTLRDQSESGCEPESLDGTSYVVEINQNKNYRTYKINEKKCEGIQQMEEIADIIGEEFDSGQELCQTTEWFACTKFLKLSRQNSKQ